MPSPVIPLALNDLDNIDFPITNHTSTTTVQPQATPNLSDDNTIIMPPTVIPNSINQPHHTSELTDITPPGEFDSNQNIEDIPTTTTPPTVMPITSTTPPRTATTSTKPTRQRHPPSYLNDCYCSHVTHSCSLPPSARYTIPPLPLSQFL